MSIKNSLSLAGFKKEKKWLIDRTPEGVTHTKSAPAGANLLHFYNAFPIFTAFLLHILHFYYTFYIFTTHFILLLHVQERDDVADRPHPRGCGAHQACARRCHSTTFLLHILLHVLQMPLSLIHNLPPFSTRFIITKLCQKGNGEGVTRVTPKVCVCRDRCG